MSDTAISDRAGEATADVVLASRAERRVAARQMFVRRTLAVTAGAGVAASALAFVALSRPTAAPTAQLHLPSANAANAAFVTGLLSAKKVAATPATTAVAATPAGAVSVMIENYTFSPATLTISAGTKVTWTNMDTAPHTVTVDSGPVTFSSPTLQKGDTFTYTFSSPGTYSYYCAVHPDMTAKVVVTGSTPTATPTDTPSTSPTTPTATMTMPTTETSCALSTALSTFLAHVNSAHLDESPGQQAQDILDIDSYVGNHLALFERMLEPLTNGGLSSAVSTGLQALFVHIDAGHLGESPGQQAQDILDFNQYIATHLALFQKMASGFEGLAC
jgi:plastocyanin